MKKLFVDLRNSHELECKRFKNEEYINIPAENVKYNLDHLLNISEEYDKVYLICNTGNRARTIKNMYFREDTKFVVNKKHFSDLKDNSVLKKNNLCLSLTRYIQIISSVIILIIFVLSEKINPTFRYFYLFLSFFMFYVGVSGNCFISKFLVKY